MDRSEGFRDRTGAPEGAVRTVAQDLTPFSDVHLRRLLIVRVVRLVVYGLLLVVGIVLAVRLQDTAFPEVLALSLLSGALVLACITAGGLVRVRMELSARRRVEEVLRSGRS